MNPQAPLPHALTSSYADLTAMLEDMSHAPPLFQPTQFWSVCLKEILEDLDQKGVHTFKSHPSALQYYVQRYAYDSFLFQKETFDELCKTLASLDVQVDKAYTEFSDGVNQALADFRVFKAGDFPEKLPHLDHISEDSYGTPITGITVDGKFYSVSLLSYLRKLVFLKKHVNTDIIRNVLEIGGGYGTLGEILLKADPKQYFYVNIDIPPLSYISTHYLQKLFGKDAVADYATTRNMDVIDVEALRKQYRAVVLCPWQLPKVQGHFELFVNASSFQEMEPEVMDNYVQYVNKLVSPYLLLKNSRGGKKPALGEDDLGVKKPILRDDYLKAFDNFELLAHNDLIYGHVCENHFRADVMVLQKR